MIFGCRKDAATLDVLPPKATFAGVVVRDDAAVYRGFTPAQQCRAHLLRKAIKLTLLKPQNTRYRMFCDGLLAVSRSACAAVADIRVLSAQGEPHSTTCSNTARFTLRRERRPFVQSYNGRPLPVHP